MARPWKHPKTGVYWFRRTVPEALRAAAGVREWKRTLGTKDPTEAKRRYVATAAQFEAAMELAKTRARSSRSKLSPKEIAGLGAKWFRRELAKYEADRTAFNEIMWEIEMGRLEDAGRATSVKGGDPDNDEPGPDPVRIAKEVAPEVDALLKEQEINIDRESVEYKELAETIYWNKFALARTMMLRTRGDWSLPEVLAKAPEWKSPADKSKTLQWAFDAWAAERKPARKTAYEYQRIIEEFGKERPIGGVSATDVVAFKDRAVRADLMPNSIDKKLSALRSVFRWAVQNKHIAADPTAGIVVVGLKQDRERKKRVSYTKDEAQALLRAAKEAVPTHRWLTWLLAATGCRIQEIAQAYASDVKQAGRVWFIDITDQGEGQSLKTPKARRQIPLHPKLKAEGFLDYVRDLPKGSRLFPNIKPDARGNWAGNVDKTLNRWASKIVPGKSAHCWRHAFKTAARSAGIPEDVSDYLTGHQGGGVGRAYGEHDLPALARQIARIDFGAE